MQRWWHSCICKCTQGVWEKQEKLKKKKKWILEERRKSWNRKKRSISRWFSVRGFGDLSASASASDSASDTCLTLTLIMPSFYISARVGGRMKLHGIFRYLSTYIYQLTFYTTDFIVTSRCSQCRFDGSIIDWWIHPFQGTCRRYLPISGIWSMTPYPSSSPSSFLPTPFPRYTLLLLRLRHLLLIFLKETRNVVHAPPSHLHPSSAFQILITSSLYSNLRAVAQLGSQIVSQWVS